MPLSRALTTAGFLRKNEPRPSNSSGNNHRRGTISKPTISGPINLISTTNIMVQQAMADRMPPPGTVSPFPALMPIGSIPPSTPSVQTHIPTHGSTSISTSAVYARPPSKSTAAFPPVSSSAGPLPSLTPSKSVSSSKTDSVTSQCPSLVTDGSSPKSPTYNSPNQFFDSAQTGQGEMPISPSILQSTSSFSSLPKHPGPTNSGSVRANQDERKDSGEMPAIPARAPSRSFHHANPVKLPVRSTSPPVVRRDSSAMFSTAPLTPPPHDPGLFSEEFEALDEVARDLSDTVKTMQNHVEEEYESAPFPVYTAADYHALIEPLYQQFIVGSTAY